MSISIGRLLQNVGGSPIFRVSLIVSRPVPTFCPINSLRPFASAIRSLATTVKKGAKTGTTRKKVTPSKTKVAKKRTTASKTKRAKPATAKKTPVKKKTTKTVAKTAAKKKTVKKTTKKSTKVSAKKKTALKKKAAPKKKKKVLSDEEKFKEKVKVAKKLALRTPPYPHTTAYNMFCRVNLKDAKGFIPITNELAISWKSLPQPEKTRYTEMAQENKDRLMADYNKFLNSYSVEEIEIANRARRWLKKHQILRVDTTLIKDPRRPKKAITPYLQFMKENYQTFEGTDVTEKAKAAGKAWKALSEGEKKPYIDMFVAQREKVDTTRRLLA